MLIYTSAQVFHMTSALVFELSGPMGFEVMLSATLSALAAWFMARSLDIPPGHPTFKIFTSGPWVIFPNTPSWHVGATSENVFTLPTSVTADTILHLVQRGNRVYRVLEYREKLDLFFTPQWMMKASLQHSCG